ncbi:hypothetical protein ABPG77_005449 [Micractinium sp. CCAP 211/92]
MRRRPGLQGLTRDKAARDQFKAVGDQVNATKLEAMKALMRHFQASLQEFALKHRQDIRRDPVFRAQFHAMCANIGVDPLSSNKGTWNKLLGFGDFYYELGVQVVEACITARPFTGGLMELGLVHKYVQRRRGAAADPVSEDDLARAIERLAGLGSGFGLVTIGGKQFVRSVPTELSTDSNSLIELAERLGGYFSLADALSNTGWQEERLRDALAAMAREGLLLIDDQPGKQEWHGREWRPRVGGPASSSSTTGGGSAATAAPSPLAAGLAASGGSGSSSRQRLYWVPAVGVLPAIEHYRQAEGLAGVPSVRLADVAAIGPLGGTGGSGAQAGGAQGAAGTRAEEHVAAMVAGIGGIDLAGGHVAERQGS